jgi:hypothetical protein
MCIEVEVFPLILSICRCVIIWLLVQFWGLKMLVIIKSLVWGVPPRGKLGELDLFSQIWLILQNFQDVFVLLQFFPILFFIVWGMLINITIDCQKVYAHVTN